MNDDKKDYSISDDLAWGQMERADSAGDNDQPSGTNETGEKQELNPKKRGLGRGLDALFGDEEDAPSPADPESAAAPQGRPEDLTDALQGIQRTTLGIDQLSPNPDQPRKEFRQDSLDELADSISRHGVLQPLLVRPKFDGTDGYEIIAGERRWRACQIARVHTVPVVIHDLGDEQTLELALIENLQREDLNAIDEAHGYQRLIDEFDKTQKELAEELGKSRSHITNSLRLINLPESVQAMIRDGKLSAGHARTLVKADDPEETARQIIEGNLSVRQAEALATQTGASKKQQKPATGRQSPKTGKKGGKAKKDVDTLALEEDASNLLGMKVSIDMYDDHGRLTVTFKDLDQLDDLLHRLTHSPSKHGYSY